MSAADKIAEARALIEPREAKNEGHGHVFPRPDGVRMRCGGPPMCKKCAADLARKPDLRDTVAALADLADAQASENANLRGLLWYAWHEFNAIRARDGAPRGSDICCGGRGPALVSEEWWSTLTEAFADAIGKEAHTPWPSPEAKDVGATLKATP